MSLGRHAFVISFFTLISRITGFIRDMFIAWFLGTSYIADAFFVAQKIPNLFRSLFAEGAFNSAFTPMFADRIEEKNKSGALKFANEAFSGLFYTLLAFVVLVEIFMPQFIGIIAPGLLKDPARFDLVVRLTRITFPFLVFVSSVSVMAGMLNGIKKFAAAAATPVVLNLTLITAMIVFTKTAPAYILSYATLAAGLIECLFLYFFLKKAGLKLRLTTIAKLRRSITFKKFIHRFIPGVLSAGIYQINLFVDTFFISFLPHGAISWMYYAGQLYHLPMALIGVSIGTALLPILTRQIRAKDKMAEETAANAVELNLFFALPAMAGLFVLAEPIIVLLFQRGAFTAEAAHQTAVILRAYATGLPAYVLSKTLMGFFYARKDTKTPAKIAALALVTNIVLNTVLMLSFGAVGIAVATSLTAYVTLTAYLILVYKRGYFRFKGRTLMLIAKLALITAVMTAYLVLFPFEKNAIFLILGIASSGMIYFALAFLLKAMKRNWIR